MGPLAASAAAASAAAIGSPAATGAACSGGNPWAASPRAAERAAGGQAALPCLLCPRACRLPCLAAATPRRRLALPCSPAAPSSEPALQLGFRVAASAHLHTPPPAHLPLTPCSYQFLEESEEPPEERLAFSLLDGRAGVLGIRGRRISDTRPRRPAWQALASGGGWGLEAGRHGPVNSGRAGVFWQYQKALHGRHGREHQRGVGASDG